MKTITHVLKDPSGLHARIASTITAEVTFTDAARGRRARVRRPPSSSCFPASGRLPKRRAAGP